MVRLANGMKVYAPVRHNGAIEQNAFPCISALGHADS